MTVNTKKWLTYSLIATAIIIPITITSFIMIPSHQEVPQETTNYSNMQTCSEMDSPYRKDACYTKIAKESKNSSICEMVYTPSLKDSCYENISISLGDFSLCKKIFTPWGQDDCYEEVAIKTQDVTICENVDPSWNTRDKCILHVARAKQNPSLCEKIQSQKFKTECYSELNT